MAELETPLPEDIKLMQCGHLNNHHQVFAPIIAECKTDGAVARLNCANSGDCELKIGAHSQENLTGFCPCEKAGEKSEFVNSVLGFKFGCLKVSDSSALLDSKDVVGMDLVGKEDQGLDLEAGRDFYSGVGTFWGSARRLFGNALDKFMPGDTIQSFDGSIAEAKKILPTFCNNADLDMGKPVAENLESKVAVSKSKCKNGENYRNTKLIGTERLRNENGSRHIKHSNKKPPRPPRPPRPPKETTDPSQEDLVKAMLRRAKLERIAHLKEKQIAKSKASNISAWALAFTLCFCFVLIFQGVFSQGNGSVQISPEAAVQESTLSVHKYVNHATNAESLHAMEQGQPSGSLYHVGYAMDKAGSIESNQGS
ncbi:hypothetical protein SUGI_0636290 [Cryptomeria japonica]|uniref:uncharacterized protein LOC131051077 n=1 Tax=Cryptomeria japonica TaxID=3369 RepID=UPI00241475D1|nr:uncharacterized protein LOC131051077 [Cryptomeria japonica]GLJ31666.1 hypothetical protein SUGI_0636290 [Cryptomeria japonica]